MSATTRSSAGIASTRARSFASPAIRSLMQRRPANLAGWRWGWSGLALLVALASYTPSDPSLNTATAQATRNLAGPVGAVVSDLLLQGFRAWPARCRAWRCWPGLGGSGRSAGWAAWRRGWRRPGRRCRCWPRHWKRCRGCGRSPGRPWRGRAARSGGCWPGDAGRRTGPAGAGRRGVGLGDSGSAFAVTLALLALGLSAAEWRAGWRFVGRDRAVFGLDRAGARGVLGRRRRRRRTRPVRPAGRAPVGIGGAR